MHRALRAIGKGWMRFAHVLGRINTFIILTLFYVILAPFGLLARLLPRKTGRDGWIEKKIEEPTLESLRQLF